MAINTIDTDVLESTKLQDLSANTAVPINLGAVTATSVTSSGAVSGTTGTFTGAVAGTTGTFTGAVAGTTGTFTGAVSANGAMTSAAFSGVVETDGTYVDAVIFGPARDGVQWDEKLNLSTVKKIMVATIKDAGADTTVEIWDYTDSTIVGGTAMAAITITGAATPTSIAASMGYIIVGSEDGIHIIHPHFGSWAEATTGWPRSLNSTDTPNLNNNDVIGVAANTLSSGPTDSNTGGQIPTFGVKYGTGTFQASVIKNDGTVKDVIQITATSSPAIAIGQDMLFAAYSTSQFRAAGPIDTITADQSVNPPYSYLSSNGGLDSVGISADAFSIGEKIGALGGTGGLDFTIGRMGQGSLQNQLLASASITRATNSGYMLHTTRGVWLCNSATADLSPYANTLTNNGAGVTEVSADGATGELKAYNGYSSTINHTRASDEDWDVCGTGPFHMAIWFKSSGNSTGEVFCGFGNAARSVESYISFLTSGVIDCQVNGASASASGLATTETFDDGAWHKADLVNVSSTERYLYVDGVLEASDTTNTGSMSDSGNMPFAIGSLANGSTNPATSTTLTMCRFAGVSSVSPSAALIRNMYLAEKPMFDTAALVLLQSGTTDAVLDVDVDPVSGKVAVVQADDKGIWDGLVYTNSVEDGASTAFEHLKLWGEGHYAIGATDASINMPAEDFRELAETVRGLGIQHEGIDLSKAKAWLIGGPISTSTINGSYGIESVTWVSTGHIDVVFATPFKESVSGADKIPYVCQVTMQPDAGTTDTCYYYDGSDESTNTSCRLAFYNGAGAARNVQSYSAVWFGELEGE
jgi:hypothetical protein